MTLNDIFKVLEEKGQVLRYSRNIKFENVELNHLSFNS